VVNLQVELRWETDSGDHHPRAVVLIRNLSHFEVTIDRIELINPLTGKCYTGDETPEDFDLARPITIDARNNFTRILYLNFYKHPDLEFAQKAAVITACGVRAESAGGIQISDAVKARKTANRREPRIEIG
jgi:hypothetical protein